MIKFKFVNRDFGIYDEDDFNSDFRIVDNPIDYNKLLPDGEYLIRGDKKSHAKKYYHCFNKWYLVEDKIRDNGHYMCDCTEYLLFPQKSEKEWSKLTSVPYKCLSPTWQRYLSGYQFYMQLRKLTRDVKKDFIKYKF